MKKTLIILIAFAAMTVVGCKEQQPTPAPDANQAQEITTEAPEAEEPQMPAVEQPE